MSSFNIFHCFDDGKFGPLLINDIDIKAMTSEDVKTFMQQLSIIFLKDLNKIEQNNISKVFEILLKHHLNDVQSYLKLAFVALGKAIISAHSHINGVRGFGASSLYALRILIQVLKAIPNDQNMDNSKSLLQFLILLPSGCYLSARVKIVSKCTEVIRNFFKQNQHFIQPIAQIIDSNECKSHFISFISILSDFKKDALKEETLINYVKLLFGDKQQIPSDVVDCISPLLKCVINSRIAFEEYLLPTMSRMALRSPEKALWVINSVLKNLMHIDLSMCFEEFSKVLLTQLQSKNENLRLLSKKCILCVVSLISDKDSLNDLVTLIISMIIGTDKVVHLDTRLTIYNTLSEITEYLSLGSASAKVFVAHNVLEHITPAISKETQESIIIGALECVTHWSKLDPSTIFTVLATWFKTNAFNPKYTPAVKLAYFSCLNECYNHVEKLATINVTQLQDILDKTSKSTMLITSIHEVLPITDLLLRYSVDTDNVIDKDPLKSTTLPGLIFNICGLKTSITNSKMFSDQSLLSATHKSLVNILNIAKNLILNYYDILSNLPNHLALIIRSLVLCGLHESYISVRKHALEVLSTIVRSIHGPAVVTLVVDYVKSMNLCDPQHLISSWFWPISNGINLTNEFMRESVSPFDFDSLRSLVHRLTNLFNSLFDIEYKKKSLISNCITSESIYPTWWNEEVRAKIMLTALSPLNQHMITLFFPNVWSYFAQRLIGNTDYIVDIARDDIIARFINVTTLNKNDVSMLHCLCLNFSDKMIKELIAAIIKCLEDNSLLRCSEDEVGIMNTREGYLFNKTLLHSLPKYESNKSNIKRENKMYSYKDQMAGLEIKRELEEKKKKNDNKKIESDNPIEQLSSQLTKNHKEQISNELLKEKHIRLRIQELENKVIVMTDLLRHISTWRKDCFLNYYDNVIKVLQKLIMKSSVGRMQASLLYNDLHVLSSLTKKQSIWVLRILFFDSSQFNDGMRDNWEYNDTGKELIHRLSVLCPNALNEYSTEFIDIVQKKTFDFTSFLYILPAFCQLCESIADMENINNDDKNEQWWNYLTWMDINSLMSILTVVRNQIWHGQIDKRQLFNTDLLQVLVKVTQNTEINDVHQLVNKIVLKMMEMFNVEESNVELSNTNVFETILKCFVTNTVEARVLALNCIETITDLETINKRRLSMYILVAKHDVDESIEAKAADIWTSLNLSADENMIIDLIDFVILQYDQVSTGSIKAITSLIEIFSNQLEPLMSHIFMLYEELAYIKPPTCDDFGRVLIPSPPDKWVARLGLAKTLIPLSKYVSEESLVSNLFNFLIPVALNDRNQHVRSSMLQAGQDVIECVGKENITLILAILEDYLSNADNIASNDIVRQSVIILMGSLAKHLDASDERFNNIFGKLIEALNFPSADVQRAVSDTFDPLVKAFDEERQRSISDSLIAVLFNSKEVAERKGAAFGIAGIIKAVGITKLKTFKINDALIDGIQNKTSEVHRELALFTYEQISAKMGRMFEPYVPQLVKYLLDTFADPSPRVRDTSCRTARMLMSNLSAPGVKIILNPLLAGLDTNQWRTKSVSVELLGSMAYCAPKQLSNCLPTIVPKILSILSDSHPNVIKSGRQALREIGSVIQNKEIEIIVPILIDALCDPIKKTDEGLDCLISTKFVHQVDAPSLAIIMSMVSRAFKERRSETKRKAAQIIANLHSLIDDKDLEPYCANLLPGLKGCLVDPDPGVREVASIALGTIAKVMDTTGYSELMVWLMDALKDESSGVNRSGAAQGLSEVLLQKGVVHLDKFMPDILENTSNTKLLAHVRDGYLMLYIHLPKRFHEQFAHYVKDILPSILQALSDEVEFIRETALNAGQGIIEIYSHIAIDTMLPNLESGMLDSNWRIRYSSIKLLGELLFRLTGISGKGTTVGGNDDESFAQSSSQAVIEANLGAEKYKQVLAEIFLARMDVALQVRQAAIHIWKLMVVNTARCLRMIMSELMTLVLDCLSGEDNDNRIMATKSLGDVVKKLGERSLPEIFHDLEVGFENCSPNHRIGVCNAILEILKACPKEQIVNYLDKVMPTFKSCLCDENVDVRNIAGEIFELLHSALGIRIVDIVIPDLVEKLDDNVEGDHALNGLCTLVNLKGRFVIPSLIPRLTFPTVNTKAFSALAKVAGDILSRHVVTVLPALLQAVSNVVDCENEMDEIDNCCQVILAMDDAQTTQIILKELTTFIGNMNDVNQQIAGLKIMSGYMKSSSEDDFLQSNRVLMNYIPMIIRSVVKLFAVDKKQVLIAAFDCLIDIINSLGSSNIEYVKDIRDSILVVIRDHSTKTGVPAENVIIPAFSMEERSINSLIDLYREALVNGRSELKEVAASGMEDCISATETKVLTKSAVKISGPLIRTMSERHNAQTKAAIVSSLGKLITKCPLQVKLFATQMQTIFTKCLADPNPQLRYKSAIAQSRLATIIMKPDVFFNELSMREFNEDNLYKAHGIEAMRYSLETAGKRLSKETVMNMINIFQETLGDKDDQIRVSGAACLGVTLTLIVDNEFYTLLESILKKNVNVLYTHGLMTSLMILCKSCSERIFDDKCPSDILSGLMKLLNESCANDKVFIATTAYRTVGYIANYLINAGTMSEHLAQLLSLLQNGMKQQSLEVKDVVVDVCGYLVWCDVDGVNVNIYAKAILAILINGYRAKENALRSKSEKRIMDLVRMSVSLRKVSSTDAGVIDDSVYKMCCDSLEQGTKATLAEVVSRFKKTYLVGITKETPTYCPELDNSYIKVSMTD